MKIHFCGIGGIGMSALAQLCLSRGETVTGSDQGKTDITDHLQSLGVTFFDLQQAANVDGSVDLLVYTEAVPPTNPERTKAAELGIPQKSYFGYLGELSKDLRTIAVAGTHGKTTTTAMIGEAMIKSGFEATVVVGSKAKGLGDNNFHAGSNDWFVVEACEYRNNFQYLNPEIVLMTNLEWDHPDAFPDEASYFKVFRDFCSKAKVIIYHEGDKNTEKMLEQISNDKYQITKIGVSKDIVDDIRLKTPGIHNRENAALALALGEYLLNPSPLPPSLVREEGGSCPPDKGDRSQSDRGGLMAKYEEALNNFSGTWRRQEYLEVYQGHPVYDDYGHHPTEITSTLQAFREGFPGSPIALIFQPHQYSRTRHFVAELREALAQADHTAVVPIFQTRDSQEDVAAVSIKDVAKDDFPIIENTASLQDFIKSLPEDAIILFMGAGDISKKARNFLGGQPFGQKPLRR
ncbi:MAG TPA: UDP-N-acetylmuramate--L-alanine ligase [Candidatus Gracilibacteria bacterium]